MERGDAEDRFLRIAQNLPEYSIVFHSISRTKFKKARKSVKRGIAAGAVEKKDTVEWLGGSPRGILLFEQDPGGTKHIKNKFGWSVLLLSFSG
jgi:hypothetical protein